MDTLCVLLELGGMIIHNGYTDRYNSSSFYFDPPQGNWRWFPLFHGSSQMESVRSFEYFAQLQFLGPFASNLVWRVSPPGSEVTCPTLGKRTIIDSNVPVGMGNVIVLRRVPLCFMWKFLHRVLLHYCWVACQSNDHEMTDDLHCSLSFCPVYHAIIYTLYQLYHTVPCWMAQYIIHLDNSIFVYRIRYNLIAYDAVYFDKKNLHFNVSWQGWPGQGLWVLSNGHCPTRYVGNFNLNIVMIMLKPSPVGT